MLFLPQNAKSRQKASDTPYKRKRKKSDVVGYIFVLIDAKEVKNRIDISM